MKKNLGFKSISIGIFILIVLLGAFVFGSRVFSHMEQKEFLFVSENKSENIYLEVDIVQNIGIKKESLAFSLYLNDKLIFELKDLYQLEGYDKSKESNLYLYSFEKQNITKYKCKLIFVVKSSVLRENSILKLKTSNSGYGIDKLSLKESVDINNTDEDIKEMYKLLELLSYYQEQVSMDYKNIYLAYRGYQRLKELIFNKALDPQAIDEKINYISKESKLNETLNDILDELYFDAERQAILSNESVSKDRYLELLGFYKNNHMVQAKDIEDILSGG